MSDMIRARLDELDPPNSGKTVMLLGDALRNVLQLCEMAYVDPRTMGWYIKRGIARELGLNEDEVEF